MTKQNLQGYCIWIENTANPGDIVFFKKTFHAADIPNHAKAYIAAETKYFLYLNGHPIVMDGGLFRESLPGCGYADEVDLTPFLQKGENTLEITVHYYGNDGRNNVNSGRAGLWFDCPALGIVSDNSFLCATGGYFTPKDDPPSYLYGGDHLGFDSRENLTDYKPAVHVNAKEWGDLYLRPIPLHRFSKKQNANFVYENDMYTIDLPYAMSFYPSIQVEALGGEILRIYTDRHMVNGGPGDETNVYRGHRIEYICKKGLNDFTSILYLYGEKFFITCDATIKLSEAGYIETGYDTDIVGYFRCGIPLLDKLVEKSARTLYVCMRDNFMDCPDRERGQWIGDVTSQVPQVFFLLDPSAHKLVRKAILDFIQLRDGDILKGNVPGVHSSELPAQSLCAISQWGLIAQYVKYSGDDSVLDIAFEPIVRYLQLWDIKEDGLLAPRDGNWRWFDHLLNIDDAVLENAWYYSALQFAKETADTIGNHKYDVFLNERLSTIKNNFNKSFWKGSYYSSKDSELVDDRANAMAVLAGLCCKTNYDKIRTVLLSVFNATVYMEGFVLTALCEMGYIKDAYNRMCSRYYNLAVNENSTLWEDFFILGTKNHAWSGTPATLAFRYFMGIDTNDGFKTITTNPCKELFPNGCECGFYGHDVAI